MKKRFIKILTIGLTLVAVLAAVSIPLISYWTSSDRSLEFHAHWLMLFPLSDFIVASILLFIIGVRYRDDNE